jgi:hypothetical protein
MVKAVLWEGHCVMQEMQEKSQRKYLDERLVRRLVRRTGSLLPWQRKAARSALLVSGEEAFALLIDLFAREQRARKRRTTWYRYTSAGVLIFAMSSLIGCFLGGANAGVWVGMCGPALLMLFFLLTLSTVQTETRRQALLANALALFDNVCAIGPLTEALHYKQQHTMFPVRTRQQAIEALTALLPQLESDQADLLDAEHRAYLYPELGPRLYSDFVVEIIEVLTRICDTQAIPHVRRIAQRADNPIQRRAQRCLMALEAVAEQERQSQTLLRATATASETPQTVLLRAAQAGATTAPQQLLRATEENAAQVSN